MKNWEEYKDSIEYYDNGWVKNWFSNMIQCDIEIDDIKYKSTENYYQSKKMKNYQDELYIANLDPHSSKRETRNFEIVDDWNDIKIDVMRIALEAKFNLPKWKDKLLSTGNDKIIEWNNWGDNFWGVSDNDHLGQNHLGLLLMEIRTNLRMNTLFKK